MSKLVMVPGINGAQFAAIERDDGTLVFASDQVPEEAGGIGTKTADGKRWWFVREADFEAELSGISGESLAPHQDVETATDETVYVTPGRPRYWGPGLVDQLGANANANGQQWIQLTPEQRAANDKAMAAQQAQSPAASVVSRPPDA